MNCSPICGLAGQMGRQGAAIVRGVFGLGEAPGYFPPRCEMPFSQMCFVASKRQNLSPCARSKKTVNLQRKPILEVIDTLNSHGIEVAAVASWYGFRLRHAEQTPLVIAEFIRASQLPIQTVNILYALPKTPLYDRLKAAGRIVCDDHRDSNIQFLQPYEQLVNNWRRVISPELMSPRPFTIDMPPKPKKPTRIVATTSIRLVKLRHATFDAPFSMLSRLVWYAGLRSNYRAEFWSMFWTQSYAEVRSRTSSRSPWSPTILSGLRRETASPAARTHPTTPKEFEHRLLPAMKSPVET